MKNFGKALFIYLLLSVGKVYSQPGWSVNPGSYDYSMTITGVINLNNTEERDIDNMVGAFVGGVCRGVAKPVYDAKVNRYVVYLLVYSSATSETVDFQVFDASTASTIVIPKTIQFSVNKIAGTSEAPYFWSNPTLSSDANILTYGFAGQSGTTVFDTTRINVEMPVGTDIKALVANFTTSPNALVQVNSNLQTSGISSNNFSNPVEYHVVAADESAQKNYTVYVSIANGIPSDLTISKSSIQENSPLNTIVGTLSTTDINPGDTFTYSLISGSGDTDNSAFKISGNSLLLNSVPDYETKKSYKIRLKTEDQKGGTFEKEFTIEVTDQNDETPVLQNEKVFIPENAPLGTEIKTVIVTDQDKSADLRFDIFSGNDLGKFAINRYSGKITLVSSLDFETKSIYTLEIFVSDGIHDSVGVIDVVVTDVNDNSPVIKNATINVSENKLSGDSIFTVTASDADVNSVHTYSILSGNQDGVFAIGANSGIVILAGDLDFELKSKHVLEIQVSDGANTATSLLVIVVQNENDELPVLKDTSFSVSEFATIDEVIGQLMATDKDANSAITFSLDSKTDAAVFSVGTDGQLKVAGYLDYEEKSLYHFVVKVSDGLNTSTGKVTVYVTNKDEAVFKATNAITPNNDGANDFWEVENAYLYRDCKFIIYNHVGETVFTSIGYDNDWNGSSSTSDPLPVGTYFYVVICSDCKDCKTTGFISIVR